MHRLEITGATPEDLFMNAVRMLSVLLKGGATTVPAEPAADAPSVAEASPPADGVNLTASEVVAKAKARRGKKDTEPKVLNDEIPDLAKTIEHEPQVLTLEGDIRPRLRAIQKAHAAREHSMAECVAYIQKLYGPFGIAKADQLRSEQFAEFMEASEGYLTGEA